MEACIPIVAVIGGGAAGIFAALSAAREARRSGKEIRISIYEKNDRIGKKILMTGNGRCNLSNACVGRENYFGETALFEKVFAEFGREQTLSLFSEFGLQTTTDAAGRIYPKSLKAASVLDALLFACETYGISVVPNTDITDLKKHGAGYLINNTFYADAVILSAGGKVSAGGKETDSIFPLLTNRHIIFRNPVPALTAFSVRSFPKSLKGVRAAAKVTLLCKDATVAQSEGELQYTEYGLSGIPAMQLSSYAARLPEKEPLVIRADSAPDITFPELKRSLDILQKSSPEMPVLLFMTGLVPKPLGIYLLKEAGLEPQRTLRDLKIKEINLILEQIKKKDYRISGLRPFSQAQVTSGGIVSAELTGSLMLKKLPGVYACGELIDINGDCGGYNLQWAWSSGYVAGRNCVRESI